MRRILFLSVLSLFVFVGVNLLADEPSICINQFINSNSSPIHFSVNPENEHPVQMLFYGVNTDSIYLLKFNKDGSVYKQYDLSALLDRYLNCWGESYAYLRYVHAADLLVTPKDTRIVLQDISDFYFDTPQDGIVTFKFNKYNKISTPEEYVGNHFRQEINPHTSQSVKFLDEGHVILYTTDCDPGSGKCKNLITYRSLFTLDDEAPVQQAKLGNYPLDKALKNSTGGDALEPWQVKPYQEPLIEWTFTEATLPRVEEAPEMPDVIVPALEGSFSDLESGDFRSPEELQNHKNSLMSKHAAKSKSIRDLILASAKNFRHLNELGPLTLIKAGYPESTYIERDKKDPDTYNFYFVHATENKGYSKWYRTKVYTYTLDKNLTYKDKLLPKTASVGVKEKDGIWNTYLVVMKQDSVELLARENGKWKKASIPLSKNYLPLVWVKPAITYYKNDEGKEMLFIGYATKKFGAYHFSVDLKDLDFAKFRPKVQHFTPEKI